MPWLTFVSRGTQVTRRVHRTKGKPCFRGAHGRSVDEARDPHPAATARHARQPLRPSPDHHTSGTALRAGSDKPEHDNQDRRTT
ncbi:hypothetical protein GCM10022206_73840 [Streptomyces chiangmaiensis]